MFRNMFRTKAQKEEDFEKMSLKLFPFGPDQEKKMEELVYLITRDQTSDTLAYFFFLSAFNKFYDERETRDFTETLKALNKMKPRVSKETQNHLLSLMELSSQLESLDAFPTMSEVYELSLSNPHFKA